MKKIKLIILREGTGLSARSSPVELVLLLNKCQKKYYYEKGQRCTF